MKYVGTCLDGCRKWEDYCVISSQSQKYLWLYFFSLFKRIRKGKGRWNFYHFLFPFPFLFFLTIFIFSKLYLYWNFLQPSIPLATKVCFLEFLHLFLMFALDDCWWELFKSLEMFHFHEITFNWDGISRIWSCILVNMKELKSAENRTQSMHDVRIFWVWYRCVCIFLIFFLDSRLPYENSCFWITWFHWV